MEHKGNKGAMDKYCSHHAAILLKASEKEENEDRRTLSYLESPLSSEQVKDYCHCFLNSH